MVAWCVLGFVPVSTIAAEEAWFPVRTHNPFLQIYGLPTFEGAGRLDDGATTWLTTLDVANHADASTAGGESIVLDGESYYLNFRVRHGLTDWLEVGVDVPLVAHANGILDPLIEGWHDVFGMTNSKRTGPRNRLEFRYAGNEREPFALVDDSGGLGDVRLTAAVPLGFGEDERHRYSVRATLKLPTGDADALRGSGAADLALGAYGSTSGAFGLERLDITAHAGILLTGESDLFGDIQESAVPFGGVAADWRFNQRLRAIASLYAQGSYYDSALDEFGGSSMQLMLGGDYRFAGSGLTMSFGIVEELFSDATVDFAFQFAIHGRMGAD